MDLLRLDNFSGGANNRDQASRLPENNVRRAVNLDPVPGGSLELRPTFIKQVDTVRLRGLYAVGSRMFYVDGADLVAYDPETDSRRVLASVCEAGPVAAATLNGVLYLRTLEDSYAIDGFSVAAWGVDPPFLRVVVGPGMIPEGRYKLAVTSMMGGAESGADVYHLALPENASIEVHPSVAGELYLSLTNGETLYHLGPTGSSRVIDALPAGDTRQLATAGKIPMPAVSGLVSVGSMLVGYRHEYLYRTDPFRPQLVDRVTGFVSFDSHIQLLAPSGEDAVYVATLNETFYLNGLSGDSVRMVRVAAYGAVSGTLAELPDGSCSWFTQYGQVVGRPGGEIALLNGRYAPPGALSGASGFLENNGVQTVLTALRDSKPNGLAVGDSWSVKVREL